VEFSSYTRFDWVTAPRLDFGMSCGVGILP
jgi:hypothetical protein